MPRAFSMPNSFGKLDQLKSSALAHHLSLRCRPSLCRFPRSLPGSPCSPREYSLGVCFVRSSSLERSRVHEGPSPIGMLFFARNRSEDLAPLAQAGPALLGGPSQRCPPHMPEPFPT